MAARQRISSLGTQSLATRGAIYGLGLITSVAIARALGPAGRGAYFIPVTTAMIAFQIAGLGLPDAQFRLWSRKAADRQELIASGAAGAFLFGVIGVGVTALIFAVNPGRVFAGVGWAHLLIAVAVLPIMVHNSLLSIFLPINGRLPLVNGTRLVGAVVQTVGAVVLYATGTLTVSGVLVLWAATFVVPWAARLPALTRLHGRGGRLPRDVVARQIALGLRFLPSDLLIYLNLRLDVFFVARYLGLDAVGIYSIAVIFGELLWLVTDSMSQAIVERQANAPDAEAADVTARAVRIALLLTAGVGIVIGAVAQLAIPFVYGAGFSRATTVVWLLLPAAAGMAVWRIIVPMLIRFVTPWAQPVISLTALAINIAANVVLIPHLGIPGAALASAASYLTGGALTTFAFVRAAPGSFRRLVPSAEDIHQLVRLAHPRALLAQLLDSLRADREAPG